jgi:hypothetical protein
VEYVSIAPQTTEGPRAADVVRAVCQLAEAAAPELAVSLRARGALEESPEPELQGVMLVTRALADASELTDHYRRGHVRSPDGSFGVVLPDREAGRVRYLLNSLAPYLEELRIIRSHAPEDDPLHHGLMLDVLIQNLPTSP